MLAPGCGGDGPVHVWGVGLWRCTGKVGVGMMVVVVGVQSISGRKHRCRQMASILSRADPSAE